MMLMLTVDILSFKFFKNFFLSRTILCEKIQWIILYDRLLHIKPQLLCLGFDVGMTTCLIINENINTATLYVIPTPSQPFSNTVFLLVGEEFEVCLLIEAKDRNAFDSPSLLHH